LTQQCILWWSNIHSFELEREVGKHFFSGGGERELEFAGEHVFKFMPVQHWVHVNNAGSGRGGGVEVMGEKETDRNAWFDDHELHEV
jgi:hypothetical protein